MIGQQTEIGKLKRRGHRAADEGVLAPRPCRLPMAARNAVYRMIAIGYRPQNTALEIAAVRAQLQKIQRRSLVEMPDLL